VASTLNENLLLHHMLGKAKDDATRLALLGNYVDRMRQTLFRQAMFADFELQVHQRTERGEPLTGESISALYLKLLREYHGHAQGICQVDDLMAMEWAFIPHFYYNFYVFQYSTSIVASTSIAKALREDLKAGGTKVRDAYLRMLSSGSSKPAIDLLKDAGVDMTTSAPFDRAIAEMNGIMDDMEKILAHQKK
jgi:oligoendopeptidase F